MQWMVSHNDDCPTCRQPLYDLEAYRAIASNFGPLEIATDNNDDDEDEERRSRRRRYLLMEQENEEQASQHTRFRLVYCILVAILTQITVFSIYIYTSNQTYPLTTTGTSSPPPPQVPADNCPPVVLDSDLDGYYRYNNATVRAQCQYGISCRIVNSTRTLEDCQCLCRQFGSVATQFIVRENQVPVEEDSSAAVSIDDADLLNTTTEADVATTTSNANIMVQETTTGTMTTTSTSTLCYCERN